MVKSIHVRRRPGGRRHEGLMEIEGEVYPCVLGRSGITNFKREGDGATPSGSFPILYGFFRAGRLVRQGSRLPMLEINADDGWCDAPDHPAYNSLVSLPFAASHEKMLRDDRLYDVCLVLDYNIFPRARGKGSAIFFHLTREDLGPTEGCVAIAPDTMRRLLPSLGTDTVVHIHP